MDILSDILTSKDIIILAGNTLMAATLQFAIVGVEMSSRFSVKHFANDQETLDNAASALDSYLFVAFIFAIGLSSLFYLKNNQIGFIVCLLSNLIIIVWIYYSYTLAFAQAAKRHNLKYPKLLF